MNLGLDVDARRTRVRRAGGVSLSRAMERFAGRAGIRADLHELRGTGRELSSTQCDSLPSVCARVGCGRQEMTPLDSSSGSLGPGGPANRGLHDTKLHNLYWRPKTHASPQATSPPWRALPSLSLPAPSCSARPAQAPNLGPDPRRVSSPRP